MTEIEQLNSKIGGEYRSIEGRALFRIVWSENIYENRHGTFREFTQSGIFIREVTEVRKVRKYSYIHNRWIFEAWAPGNLVANPETPDAVNGDYVPVYVFEDKWGGYLPPNEKVIRFIIASLHGKIKKDEIPSREYLEEREIQRTVEALDDHPAWFQTRSGPARNAIWYAGGIPNWTYRRSTFSEVMDIPMVPHEITNVARADIFRQEVSNIEELEIKKAFLESEIARDKEILEKTAEARIRADAERVAAERAAERVSERGQAPETREGVRPRSPMHGGKS